MQNIGFLRYLLSRFENAIFAPNVGYIERVEREEQHVEDRPVDIREEIFGAVFDADPVEDVAPVEPATISDVDILSLLLLNIQKSKFVTRVKRQLISSHRRCAQRRTTR